MPLKDIRIEFCCPKCKSQKRALFNLKDCICSECGHVIKGHSLWRSMRLVLIERFTKKSEYDYYLNLLRIRNERKRK